MPLKAPVAFIESFLAIMVCYCMFNAGALTGVETVKYVSTPKSICTHGICTYCTPFAQGVKISWNCSSTDITTGKALIGSNYTYVTNETFDPIPARS